MGNGSPGQVGFSEGYEGHRDLPRTRGCNCSWQYRSAVSEMASSSSVRSDLKWRGSCQSKTGPADDEASLALAGNNSERGATHCRPKRGTMDRNMMLIQVHDEDLSETFGLAFVVLENREASSRESPPTLLITRFGTYQQQLSNRCRGRQGASVLPRRSKCRTKGASKMQNVMRVPLQAERIFGFHA